MTNVASFMLNRYYIPCHHGKSLNIMSKENELGPSNKHKIAILIDGDNAESSLIAEFISEAGRFGKVTVKRIYADWTSPQMKSWRDQLNSYAVRPIQKFAYTKNKSSTDTALIIDAMDLLHSKLVDGFCIVSSDSDYTGLAHRIREEGLFIMGIGKSHTPEAFVKSCESFTFSEILVSPPVLPYSSTKKNEKISKAYKLGTPASTTNLNPIGSLEISGVKSINMDQIQRAFQIALNIDNGQASLARLSEALRTQDPTFDPRNFGYTSFRRFCDALQPEYETVIMPDGTTINIRERQQQPVALESGIEATSTLIEATTTVDATVPTAPARSSRRKRKPKITQASSTMQEILL